MGVFLYREGDRIAILVSGGRGVGVGVAIGVVGGGELGSSSRLTMEADFIGTTAFCFCFTVQTLLVSTL